MELDTFLSSDELDDDVFYPENFVFSEEPLSSTSMFTQSPPYNCILGRFQLFAVSHCCGPGCRTIECKDKATQTLEPSPLNGDIMLPCGVSESPQRLFYGNAGYLLHRSTNFTMRFGNATGHLRQEQSAERRIARKLQCIGDQFHRLHLQRQAFGIAINPFVRQMGLKNPIVNDSKIEHAAKNSTKPKPSLVPTIGLLS